MLPLSKLKNTIRSAVHIQYRYHLAEKYQKSKSMQIYHELTSFSNPDYVTNGLVTRKQQVTYSRLRIAYRYIEECIPQSHILNCKVCKCENSHTLKHYIMQCQRIRQFRCHTSEFLEQLTHLSQPQRLTRILKIFPKFANSR